MSLPRRIPTILAAPPACAALIAATCLAAPTLSVRQFGPGNVLVEDTLAALEIKIDPGTVEPTTAILEWECVIPDGDRVGHRRTIPLAGGTVRTWIHAPGVFDAAVHGIVRLRDAETLDVLSEVDVAQGASGATIVPSGTEVILVVGTTRAGLETYDGSSETLGAPSWSQLRTVVRTIRGEDLPDRAEALNHVSTIVWTGTPEGLDAASSTAVRTWMEHGGHLVISLPWAGDPWRLASAERGPLGDILPGPPVPLQLPARRAAVLLSTDTLVADPPRPLPVRVFPGRPRGTDDPWRSVHEVGDNRPLTITRPVGFGRLTVTGLDVASPLLHAFRPAGPATAGPLPATSVFWNPVLGRRSRAPTPGELAALDQAQIAISQPQAWLTIDDSIVASSIEQTIAAGGRLVVVVAIIGLFWLVAVPVTWSVLGKRNRRDLTWPVFAIVGALAAGAAWGVAQALVIQQPHLTHLTVLDQVAGEPAHRVRSWISAQLPGTGERVVEVEREVSARPVLMPWLDAAQRRVSFPDTDTLTHDMDQPQSTPIRARATTTAFSLDWSGVIDPEGWGGVLREIEPIMISRNANGKPTLTGTIRSELPVPLESVSIVLIDARRTIDRDRAVNAPGSTPVPVRGWWFKTRRPLEPGDELSLSSIDTSMPSGTLDEQLDALARSLSDSSLPGRGLGLSSRRAVMEMLTAFSLGPGPNWTTSDSQTGDPWTHVDRRIGAALDLGPTLAQPVLLITGFLSRASLPVDLTLDGWPIESSQGEIMVRWIHPLPDTAAVQVGEPVQR